MKQFIKNPYHIKWNFGNNIHQQYIQSKTYKNHNLKADKFFLPWQYWLIHTSPTGQLLSVEQMTKIKISTIKKT